MISRDKYLTSISIFSTLIIVKIYGELIVQRHPKNGVTELTCLSEYDNSALIWNTKNDHPPDETTAPIFQPKIGNSKNVKDCAIIGGTECLVKWDAMEEWTAVNSSIEYMSPVLDFRWEDFIELKANESVEYQSHNYIGRVKRSTGSLSFSARGINDLHILLCDEKIPMNGSCYWIIIGGWEGAESLIRFCEPGPKDKTKPSSENCENASEKKKHGLGNAIEEFEWHTFSLNWDKDEGKIEIYRDRENMPFLEGSFNKSFADRLEHLSIRQDTSTRVKFHFYEYLSSKNDNAILRTKSFQRNENDLCIELFYAICADCEIEINVIDEKNERMFNLGRIHGVENDNDKIRMWRYSKLDQQFKQNLSGIDVRLEFRVNVKRTEIQGYWAIDDIHICQKSGHLMRKSTITRKNNQEAKCQKLSYDENQTLGATSMIKFHNDQILESVKLLNSCGSACEGFGKNDLICGKTGCTCLEGFKGDKCDEECNDGFSGFNCIIGSPKIIDKTDTSVLIRQNITSVLKIKSINAVIKRNGGDTEHPEIRTRNLIESDNSSSSSFSIYQLIVDNLTLDTEYALRTNLTISSSYDNADDIIINIPETNFTTTCNGNPEFLVTPNETSFYVDVTNEPDCRNQSPPKYDVIVSNREINFTRHESEPSFPRSFKNLSSYTDFKITIRNVQSKTLLLDGTFRTLEGAPSKVRNLSARTINESAVNVEWKVPEKENGIIKYYNISLKRDTLLGCSQLSRKSPEEGSKSFSTNDTKMMINNLHPYAKYKVMVSAVTVKPGEMTEASFTTNESSIPTSKISDLKINEEKKRFEWRDPEDCTTITGPINVVKLVFLHYPESGIKASPVTEYDYLVFDIATPQLMNFTKYKVRGYVIRDYGSKENPEYYQEIEWTSPPTEPPAPREFQIYDADYENNEISLRWLPPHPPNGVIESYQIIARKSDVNYLTKVLKMPEDMAKCKIWENYVCLENMEVSSFIDRSPELKITAKNINVTNSGPPSVLEISPKIWTEKPGEPEKLEPILGGYGIVKLKWDHPSMTLTKIKRFEIRAEATSTELLGYKLDKINMKSWNHEVTDNMKSYSHDLHLLSSTAYNISIISVNARKSESKKITTRIPVPGSVDFDRRIGKLEITQSGSSIELKTPEIINATKSTTLKITVVEIGGSQKSSIKAIRKWIAYNHQVDETIPEYLSIDCNKEKNSNGECFLDVGKSYKIIAEINDVDTIESKGPIESPPIIFSNDSKKNLTWIIIFPIAFICLISIVILYRYRQKMSKLIEMNSSEEYSTRVWNELKSSTPSPIIEENRLSSVNQITPDVVPNLLINRESNAVELNNFEDYTKEALANGLFDHQYQKFTRGLTKPCEYGMLPENKRKNRYKNLIAYDDSRVILKKVHGDIHSDYINANYIEGYRKEKGYIATQGPLPDTVKDFWRMIWHEKVIVICMLANVEENGRKKCEQYWPEIGTEQEYGNIRVSNINHEVYLDYTFRTFIVRHGGKKSKVKEGENERRVMHLHYTGWPDHGVPMYIQSVVSYLKKLSKIERGDGPIVVHCSAGVGRTGTIILCDICLRSLEEEEVIDLVSITKKMRQNRPNMVDNVQQYILAHLAILEYRIFDHTEIACDHFTKSKMKELREHLPSHIKRLNNAVWQDRALHFSAITSEISISEAVIENDKSNSVEGVNPLAPPSESSRISNSKSKYITAIGIDGARMKNQFLVHQLPSKANHSNFWKLITDESVELIIVLQKPDPNDPTCCDIAPIESDLLKIEYEMIAEDECNLKIEKFTLSRNGVESQHVTILTCTAWECCNEGKPPMPNTLVSLWRTSENISRQRNPTFVLCRDGVTGCGLYLALSFLLERMAVERVCDVISAVRSVRRFKPAFVQNLKQFEYLYDAALAYIEAFETYANFT